MKQWKLLHKSPIQVVIYKGSTQLTLDFWHNIVTEHYLHDNGDEIWLGCSVVTDELKKLFLRLSLEVVMNEYLRYNGFTGSIEIDLDEDILYGKILCISESFSYHGESVLEIKSAFMEVVDSYLEVCNGISGDGDDRNIRGW